MMLFAATGNAWAHPELITISFMPDATNLGGPTTILNAAFNANPNLDGDWQPQILKAAQSWAQQWNMNFAVVPVKGAPSGSGSPRGSPIQRIFKNARLIGKFSAAPLIAGGSHW